MHKNIYKYNNVYFKFTLGIEEIYLFLSLYVAERFSKFILGAVNKYIQNKSSLWNPQPFLKRKSSSRKFHWNLNLFLYSVQILLVPIQNWNAFPLIFVFFSPDLLTFLFQKHLSFLTNISWEDSINKLGK